MAEQNSATKLKEAKDALTTAKAGLRTAGEKLRRIETAIAKLEAKKRRVQEQRDQNEAALQNLKEQLQERRLEKDEIAEQVQRQNEQIDAIRGAEGRKDEQARAESRLTALNIQLDHLQKKIDWLEIRIRQTQDKQDEIDVRLQELGGKIKRKREEKKSAEKEVKSKEEDLSEKRDAVAEAVEAVNIEMVAAPFKRLIGDPIKHMRDRIFQLRDMLQFFGVASAVYVYTLLSGFVYEIQFYRSNNLDISHYATLSDFLLIPPVLYGIGSVAVTGFLITLIFLVAKAPGWIAKVSGWAAYRLSHLVGHPVLGGLLIVTLLVSGPLLAGYCKYNPSGKDQVGVKEEDTVTVLTDPPLGEDVDLVLVGSNSTYMFFKKAGDNTSSVKAIPLSRIVCVGQDCKAKAAESPNGTVPPNPKIPEENGAASALLDTVRGTMKAVQSIARWRNLDHAMTPFEETVVAALGKIEEKVGTLTSGAPVGYSDYVAEPLLQQFISERMQCEEGEEPQISDLIRFVNDEPNPRCTECPSVTDPSAGSTNDNTRYEAMKALYREKIGPKVQDIVKEFMDKSATRWTVFGFASPDGEEVENDSLSMDRAQLVIDEMCRPRGTGTSEPVIDSSEKIKSEKRKKMCADMQVRPFGEWHPINGISNSRSAVIAACVRKASR